jgi:lysophospholipase L1-like esterase
VSSPSARHAGFRSWLARIGLAVASLALGFGAIEVGYRALNPARVTPEGTLEFADSTRKPFRVRNIRAPERDDVLRILNIGDSVVEADCPATLLLEQTLAALPGPPALDRRRFADINVMNAGQGGCDAKCIQRFLDRYDDVGPRPHIATVLTGWNEHWYREKPCARIDCHQAVPILRALLQTTDRLRGCRACEALLEDLAHAGVNRERADCIRRLRTIATGELLAGIDHYDSRIYRLPLPEYERALEAIVDVLQSRGILTLLVVPPHGLVAGRVPLLSLGDCLLLDPDAYLPMHRMYTEAIRRVAARRGVGLIDLERAFDARPDRLALFEDPDFDPIHPNLAGQQVCAQVYAEALGPRVRQDAP